MTKINSRACHHSRSRWACWQNKQNKLTTTTKPNKQTREREQDEADCPVRQLHSHQQSRQLPRPSRSQEGMSRQTDKHSGFLTELSKAEGLRSLTLSWRSRLSYLLYINKFGLPPSASCPVNRNVNDEECHPLVSASKRCTSVSAV